MQRRSLDLRQCNGGLRQRWLAAVAGGAAMASANNIHGWHDVSQPHSGPCKVLAFTDAMGAKFMLILPMLRHHPLRALCCSVENICRFPCEGNVIA
jgi:hypothetical protein